MSARSDIAKRRAFTLVEMVVSLSLCVFLILLSVSLFSQSGSTSDSILTRQSLNDSANQLLRLLKKDLRSATEAHISSELLRLKVTQMSKKTDLPEQVIVEYSFVKGEAKRKENNIVKTIPFASYLKPDDYISLELVQSAPTGSGFFLEIFAISSTGAELIRIYERLLKVELVNNL